MKTNSFARGILRMRAIVLCLSIVGLAVAEIELGESLVLRFGQCSTTQTPALQAYNVSLGDLMASAPIVR